MSALSQASAILSCSAGLALVPVHHTELTIMTAVWFKCTVTLANRKPGTGKMQQLFIDDTCSFITCQSVCSEKCPLSQPREEQDIPLREVVRMAASGTIWSSDSESKMVIWWSKAYWGSVSSPYVESHHTHSQMVFHLQTVCDPYTAGGDCRAARPLLSLLQKHLRSWRGSRLECQRPTTYNMQRRLLIKQLLHTLQQHFQTVGAIFC